MIIFFFFNFRKREKYKEICPVDKKMDEYPQNDSNTIETKNLKGKWNKNGVKQH